VPVFDLLTTSDATLERLCAAECSLHMPVMCANYFAGVQRGNNRTTMSSAAALDKSKEIRQHFVDAAYNQMAHSSMQEAMQRDDVVASTMSVWRFKAMAATRGRRDKRPRTEEAPRGDAILQHITNANDDVHSLREKDHGTTLAQLAKGAARGTAAFDGWYATDVCAVHASEERHCSHTWTSISCAITALTTTRRTCSPCVVTGVYNHGIHFPSQYWGAYMSATGGHDESHCRPAVNVLLGCCKGDFLHESGNSIAARGSLWHGPGRST